MADDSSSTFSFRRTSPSVAAVAGPARDQLYHTVHGSVDSSIELPLLAYRPYIPALGPPDPSAVRTKMNVMRPAKRGRDDAGALSPPPYAERGGPADLPPAKRLRDYTLGAGGRSQPEPKVRGTAAGEARGGGTLAVAPPPRWWQLWRGRGGDTAVDYEELLWGWFPFVDEDFAGDGEEDGWLSIWGSEMVWPPSNNRITPSTAASC